ARSGRVGDVSALVAGLSAGMATRSPVRIAGFDHPGPRKTLPGINRKAQGFIPGAPTGSPQRERDGGQAAPWKAAGSPSSRAGCATVQPVLPAPSVLPIALVTTSRLGIHDEQNVGRSALGAEGVGEHRVELGALILR